MSVRKREWTTPKGEQKSAWVVDYTDTAGKRRLKTFAKKKEADQFAATATIEVRDGTHVADSASVTIETAAQFWMKDGKQQGLERSTLDQRRQHIDLHIVPFIGPTLLSKFTVPSGRSFQDKLRETGRSPAMVRKIMTSLSSIFSDAMERGLASRNPVREMRAKRGVGREKAHDKRQRGKLKIGVDIPTREEVKAFVAALDGRWRPILLTATFTGMRASELRGLRWEAVDLDKRQIHIVERADRFNDMGRPKSAAGERFIPLPPMVVNALREWKLICPRRKLKTESGEREILDLVFPTGAGKVESLGNIVNRGLWPMMVKAGAAVDTGERDKHGEPILKAKYTGMHALRHFYASWCINRKEDGGLGLPPKVVQERLGHSSIVMTMDVYGHLFPQGDDAEELAAAERSFLA
ncbi:site-specific integrase [Rhizobium leguminosarum]|uniref:site-specific integrase n=1 Tax=Rhizobium leguminosarum TaxID=384 RepID=UPI001C9277B8|nr:site-specific integrase [Rhizobium leguminosarum]MBY2921052.1 site-specific integrase [Rhizobium leguminosarum]